MARERRRAAGRSKEPRARRRRAPAAGLLLVGLLAAAFVAHAAEFRFTQDDAYISLRYAQNVVDGHGLVFNPGERVEGYSNFSWTLLLALLIRVGFPPVETSLWLGIFLGAVTVVWAARFARALEGSWGPASVITAALVAGTSAFALWSSSGLETAMFALLVTAGLERGLAPGVSAGGRATAPLLLCLAALTRPDGPLVFGVWYAIRAADTLAGTGPASEGGKRALVRDALLFAAPLVPYVGWKLAYYGDVLPNTYYAKAGAGSAYVQRGVAYAREYFEAYGAWGLSPALAVLSAWFGGFRSVELRLLLVWCAYAAYVIVIGGDVLHVHRFWLPILPIGAILVARGAVRAADRLARAIGGGHRASLGAAAGLAAALLSSGLLRNWDFIHDRREKEEQFVLNMTQTGEWLGRRLPPGSLVATTTIGAVSYYSGLPVLDMLGLTDREIARNPDPVEGLYDTWREIKYNAESVLSRAPEVILFSTAVRPSAAAEKALFLYEDFFESYYAYYFRSVPNRLRKQVCFRRRPDAPPFQGRRIVPQGFEFLDEYTEAHLSQSRELAYATAAEHFRQAFRLSGDRFPWALEWMGAALYDGQLDGGLEVLREVLARDSFSVLALMRVGEDALRRGDAETATRAFERARAIDPDDATGWIGGAQAAQMVGEDETAFRLMHEGVRLWNASPPVLTAFADLAAAVGEWESASWGYRRALAGDPEHAAARSGLERMNRARSSGGPPAPITGTETGAANR